MANSLRMTLAITLFLSFACGAASAASKNSTPQGASGEVAATENYVGPTILNGGFETWSEGDKKAPDGWALMGTGATIEKKSSTHKEGTYSAKLRRHGATCYLFQDIQNAGGHNLAFWKGRTISYGVWIYAGQASNARIYCQDGVKNIGYNFHSGNRGWEYVEATGTVSNNADRVLIILQLDIDDTAAYFDGVTVRV